MENWTRKRVRCAKQIIKQGMKNPFYTLKSYVTDKGVETFMEDSDGNYSFFSNRPGYYCIYREIGQKLECLYVGKSDSNIQGRIHRWTKGVAGKLRHDESHSAATKARQDGVKITDKILVKIIHMDDVDEIIKEYADDSMIAYEPLDEWIAPLLKSKYNTRTFEPYNTLEDFFDGTGD